MRHKLCGAANGFSIEGVLEKPVHSNQDRLLHSIGYNSPHLGRSLSCLSLLLHYLYTLLSFLPMANPQISYFGINYFALSLSTPS